MPPSLVLLGAAGLTPLVRDIGTVLLVAGVLAVAFERLRVPVVAAFLAAGVLAGPAGLSLVSDPATIETIANLGLVLLLFLIGLELDLHGLARVGRPVVLTGLLQVPVTVGVALVVFDLVEAAGWLPLAGPYVPLYLALACGFSSTLLAVQLLQRRLQMDTLPGRVAVGLLIFQDVWAIVVLAVQPSLADPAVLPILSTLLGMVVVVGVAALASRFLLPAAFRLVGRSPELVVTTALAWCFGLGLLGANLGWIAHALGLPIDPSVSLEMGAFIAGVSIATFPYAYEVVSKVVSLRDFFVTLFFVALGMNLRAPSGLAIPVLALVLAAVAVALRYAVFLPLLYVTGLARHDAFDVSTKLAQISEFCLVITYLGLSLGHLDPASAGAVVLAFVLTAVATPVLFAKSDAFYRRAEPWLARLGMKAPPSSARVDAGEAPPRLVLLGFHRLASSLVHELEQVRPELLAETRVVDFNVAHHDAIRSHGVQVAYGDLSNPDTLRHAEVDRAQVVVCTLTDDILRGTSNRVLVTALRRLNPEGVLVVSAVKLGEVRALYAAGADYVFLPRLETALGILPAVFAALNGALPEYVESRRWHQGDESERVEVMD